MLTNPKRAPCNDNTTTSYMQVTHCQIMINLSQTRSGMKKHSQKTLRYKRGLNSRNKPDGDPCDDQQQHHCPNIVIQTQPKLMAKPGQNTYKPAIRIACWIVFESVPRETRNGFSIHRNKNPGAMAGVFGFSWCGRRDSNSHA